jgi:hypothetical protein
VKLYNPQNANGFVFAVVDSKAREGTAPDYVCVNGGDVESCERTLDAQNKRSAYPHCMGRYDEFGRYLVYKPAIEGVSPGRFVMHPLAEEAYQVDRRELNYA